MLSYSAVKIKRDNLYLTHFLAPISFVFLIAAAELLVTKICTKLCCKLHIILQDNSRTYPCLDISLGKILIILRRSKENSGFLSTLNIIVFGC